MPLYNQEITAEIKKYREDMTGGLVVKNLPANAGDLGSIPGLGRFNVLLDSYVHLPQLQSSHATSTEPTPRNSWSLQTLQPAPQLLSLRAAIAETRVS